MKKLLAITVIFALVAGAAFAQDVSIGGQVQWGYTLLATDTDDTYLGGNQAFSEQHFTVNASTENAGVMFRFKNGSVQGRWDGFAHAWWAPIEQVRIDLGDDGFGGRAGITDWGFLAAAKIGQKFAGPAYEYHDDVGGPQTFHGVGFYGGSGWNNNIFGLTFKFVEGLTIKAAVKNFAGGSDVGTSFFSDSILLDGDALIPNLTFQVIYDIAGIGDVSLATDLGNGLKSDDPTGTKIYADFNLTAIENLGVQLGLAYQLSNKNLADDTLQPPMEIGLGVTYAMDDFNIKARVAAKLIGKKGDAKDPTQIAIGLLPSYNVADGVTVYGNFGFDITLPDGGDSVIGWYVNPYVSIPTGLFDLWVGFKVWSFTYDGAKAVWAVPIGLQFNF